MKKILMILTLACAALLLTQCKKGIVEQPNVTPCGETIEVSLNVDNGCSKATILGKTISWESGDRLYVVGETDGYLGYISAQNSGTTAYFTGTITKPSTATQDFHFYYTGSQGFSLKDNNTYFTYDIKQQTGTLANIAANMHLMHGIIENVDKNTTNFGTISMTSMMSIVKLKFSVSSGTVICTGGYSGVKFNVKTGVDKNGNFLTEGRVRYKESVNLTGVTSSDYYMVVLPGVQTLEFSQGLIGLSCSGPDGGFQPNTLYNENNPKNVVLGEMTYLPAIFTVNKGTDGVQGTEDDTQVKFSKGNLYWDGSKFMIEANQRDYSSTWDENHVSHFKWTRNASEAYTSDNKVSGNELFTEVDGFTVNGFTANELRSLTKDEWVCIIGERDASTVNNVTNARYSKVVIDGLKGLLLYPDFFTWPSALDTPPAATNINGSTVDFPTNYDNTEFGYIEAAGAVFLPAAGNRNGTTINNSGKTCNYWSSSCASNAYCLSVTFNSVSPGANFSRSYGYSVRLVRDVVDANAGANPLEPEPW